MKKKNKFTKVHLFMKPPKYIVLLKKYNTLVNEYTTLCDVIQSNLFKEVVEGAYKKAESMEHYKEENKKLRKKVKELKSILTTKSK